MRSPSMFNESLLNQGNYFTPLDSWGFREAYNYG